MLNNIVIRNYRNIENLSLNSLGRVNLIAGKNNTGKSTLLEAIAILMNGSVSALIESLKERGEYFRESVRDYSDSKNLSSLSIDIISSLFYRHATVVNGDNPIILEDGEGKSMSIRLVYFIVEEQNLPEGQVTKKRVFVDENTPGGNLCLEIITDEGVSILKLEDIFRYSFPFRKSSASDNIQFVRTRNINSEENSRLWDRVALTSKEYSVVEALRIVDPSIERITFIDRNRQRIPVVKQNNQEGVYPLQSFGDGVNRVLSIILALINAENGVLLLDEFENGLHYTVQKKLWEIIFNLSEKLNVKVFATTHSNDSIRSFSEVINTNPIVSNGLFLRLEVKSNKIVAVRYSPEELSSASEFDIETR